MSMVTTSNLQAAILQSFAYKMLATPTPNMIHKIPAMQQRMPANGGPIYRQRRYNALQTFLAPLGNTGITPPAQNLTAIDIDAKMDFYGSYINLNEQVVLQLQDPVLNMAALRLGVAMRQTEDELTRNMLASTASFINCSNGTSLDNPTEITRADINIVTQTLLGNNAQTITDYIQGQDRFGTAPVRNAYFAMCSTDLMSSLENVNGFININQYPSPMNALQSEWGAAGNLRFLISSIGSITYNASYLGQNVYNIFCVGMEAYCTVYQDQYSARFIYRDPMYSGPLALNGSVGCKFAEVPKICNDTWLINLRCTQAA